MKSAPPGKIKIAAALKTLLREKDFNSITTTEISKTSGVNEALIYRYFKDKRGLLHDVLGEYLEEAIVQMKMKLKDIKGSSNKLRMLIRDTIYTYEKNEVFAKILLLEVRNFPGFFESETYLLTRRYSQFVLEVIKEGIESGEFRSDISPSRIRSFILGSIEHLCLPCIIFHREILTDDFANDICSVIFSGILKK